MKKYLLIILSALLVFAFVSCKEDSGSSDVSWEDAPAYTGSGTPISSEGETMDVVGEALDISMDAVGSMTGGGLSLSPKAMKDALRDRTISVSDDGTTVTITDEVYDYSDDGGSGTITLNGVVKQTTNVGDTSMTGTFVVDMDAVYDGITDSSLVYTIDGIGNFTHKEIYRVTATTEELTIKMNYHSALSVSGDTAVGIIVMNLNITYVATYDATTDDETEGLTYSGSITVYDNSGNVLYDVVIDDDLIDDIF